ncbi:MAG: hypothetical protein U1F98_01540 [Verrucomicrobiota bacterium]
MIYPLRRRHRHIVISLGVLLPIAFVAGIAARRPVPEMESLPAGLSSYPERFSAVEWERSDLFATNRMQVRLLSQGGIGGSFAVQCAAAPDFLKPDLIVYWAAGNPGITDTLPDNARLLGTFGPQPLPLPDDSRGASGVLVLYSLADGEIVDVSRPFVIGEANSRKGEGRAGASAQGKSSSPTME